MASHPPANQVTAGNEATQLRTGGEKTGSVQCHATCSETTWVLDAFPAGVAWSGARGPMLQTACLSCSSPHAAVAAAATLHGARATVAVFSLEPRHAPPTVAHPRSTARLG